MFEVDEASGTGTGRVTVQEQFKLADGTGRVAASACTTIATCASTGVWLFAERRLEVIDQST